MLPFVTDVTSPGSRCCKRGDQEYEGDERHIDKEIAKALALKRTHLELNVGFVTASRSELTIGEGEPLFLSAATDHSAHR